MTSRPDTLADGRVAAVDRYRVREEIYYAALACCLQFGGKRYVYLRENFGLVFMIPLEALSWLYRLRNTMQYSDTFCAMLCLIQI